jgi:hypothetical protein
VCTLVGADVADALLVALGEDGLHLRERQLVVSRPRLVAAQRGDAVEDGGAVLVLALVGVGLGQLDLRDRLELVRDLLGCERCRPWDLATPNGMRRTVTSPP